MKTMMEFLVFCNTTTRQPFPPFPFPKTVFPSHTPFSSPSTSSSSFRVNCKGNQSEHDQILLSMAYDVLGVDKNFSSTQLKSAFRSKVKQFHPDVQKDVTYSDSMIRQVIQAYKILSTNHLLQTDERECLDPFDEPEHEALDVFVNETLCVGQGCPYSCVKMAPNAFSFNSSTGTARTISQGHGNDYQVQLAVGQCPRNCIHYVTPTQRIILQELLDEILGMPWCDTSAEADYLYSLITKAKYSNNRFQKPQREAKGSTENVDWF